MKISPVILKLLMHRGNDTITSNAVITGDDIIMGEDTITEDHPLLTLSICDTGNTQYSKLNAQVLTSLQWCNFHTKFHEKPFSSSSVIIWHSVYFVRPLIDASITSSA
jgi:hypothetical protein